MQLLHSHEASSTRFEQRVKRCYEEISLDWQLVATRSSEPLKKIRCETLKCATQENTPCCFAPDEFCICNCTCRLIDPHCRTMVLYREMLPSCIENLSANRRLVIAKAVPRKATVLTACSNGYRSTRLAGNWDADRWISSRYCDGCKPLAAGINCLFRDSMNSPRFSSALAKPPGPKCG